ncbi:agmatinase [Microdochium trichocladiopsis]|uniref:Agmatinase n=1 Tax=Microdochium trichocladiopsis TaxID=1682393 RepID=A0A9P8YE62_9PEZI|nr:agmatinase [Microdochium trichocladiopsis]KAH7037683.1 agmatinase [Microdochium trichocladiopsis]
MKVTIQQLLCLALGYGAAVSQACGGAHGDHDGRQVRQWTQQEIDELERKWGTDWSFSGISTFAHLKHVKCLTTPTEPFDIAIVGAPFDTAVSYRPGARFGPRAIRAASARQLPYRGFNARANINPFLSWAKIIDCGDIPVSPMDNAVALKQMTVAFEELGTRDVSSASVVHKPKLITLGGDHSLAFPALRALNKIHGGPVRVLHFDAHLDTWHPAKYPNAWGSEQANFNHGSVFWLAGQEGLIVANSSSASGKPSVHAGIRTRLSGTDGGDYADDDAQGWVRISADDMDDIGTAGVVARIMDTLGTEDPVYLSLDIDVLDPAFAPGTGTPEPGGWTTRELIRVLRGIEGLNLVGADVVEVAPAYQNNGEETALAAAQVVYELLSSMVKRGIADYHKAKVVVVPEGDDVVKDEL